MYGDAILNELSPRLFYYHNLAFILNFIVDVITYDSFCGIKHVNVDVVWMMY